MAARSCALDIFCGDWRGRPPCPLPRLPFESTVPNEIWVQAINFIPDQLSALSLTCKKFRVITHVAVFRIQKHCFPILMANIPSLTVMTPGDLIALQTSNTKKRRYVSALHAMCETHFEHLKQVFGKARGVLGFFDGKYFHAPQTILELGLNKPLNICRDILFHFPSDVLPLENAVNEFYSQHLLNFLAWLGEQPGFANLKTFILRLNLKTAVQGDKVMQDFESESLAIGVDHSLRVKATPIASDYGSKDCVNLSPSTAVFRLNSQDKKKIYEEISTFLRTEAFPSITVNGDDLLKMKGIPPLILSRCTIDPVTIGHLFYMASSNGYIEQITQILSLRPSPGLTPKNLVDALRAASSLNHAEIVEVLLQQPILIGAISIEEANEILSHAFRKNSTDVLKVLLHSPILPMFSPERVVALQNHYRQLAASLAALPKLPDPASL